MQRVAMRLTGRGAVELPPQSALTPVSWRLLPGLGQDSLSSRMKRFSVSLHVAPCALLLPAAGPSHAQEVGSNPSECIRATTLSIVLDDGTSLDSGKLEVARIQRAGGVVHSICSSCWVQCAVEQRGGRGRCRLDPLLHPIPARVHNDGYSGHIRRAGDVQVASRSAYYFLISPALRSAALFQVTARMSESPTGCSYYEIAPVDYTFHWSCPSHAWGTTYTGIRNLGVPRRYALGIGRRHHQ